MSNIYIPQAQLTQLKHLATPGKVAVVYGPRRVGKTTLIQHYVQQYDRDALLVTGEDITVREHLESQSLVKLQAFIGQRRTLIIDAAQYVRQIGLNLKLLADHVEGLRIIATGSSSFDLAQQTGEPLTGRRYTLLLLPLAQLELRLIYGSYPEVVLMESNEDRQLYIKELIASYLFKDIEAGVKRTAIVRLRSSIKGTISTLSPAQNRRESRGHHEHNALWRLENSLRYVLLTGAICRLPPIPIRRDAGFIVLPCFIRGCFACRN